MDQTTADIFTEIFKTPSTLSISDWAQENIIIPAGKSPDAGPYDPNVTPYTKGILECLRDPSINKIVWQSSAQVGKTTALLVAMLWLMKESEGARSIIFASSTLDVATAFSEDRLTPTIKESPKLNDLLDVGSRKAKNRKLYKEFYRGSLRIVGSNSESSMSSHTCRYLLADELGAWQNLSAIDLLEKRQTAFQDSKKTFYVSTPTIEGDFISTEYQASDQRRYYVPCLKCGYKQVLVFQNLIFKDQDQYLKEPYYECIKCNERHYNYHKKEMIERGAWYPTKNVTGTAGFWMNELYSPFVSFEKMVQTFLNAKNNKQKLKEFTNLSLGETWVDGDMLVDYVDVFSRRENYEDVPDGVSVLVAGVDVQNNRLEGEVIGYGKGFDSWGIEYFVIPGSPLLNETWDRLRQQLIKTYKRIDGRDMDIKCVCIDSGGNATSQVYQFINKNKLRQWYAIKGTDKRNMGIVASKSTKSGSVARPLLMIGTHDAKKLIYDNLVCNIEGEGKTHYPTKPCYNADYFKMLTAEKLITKKDNSGHVIQRFVKRSRTQRNEAIDVRVYGLAALDLLIGDFGLDLEKTYCYTPAVRQKKNLKVKVAW